MPPSLRRRLMLWLAALLAVLLLLSALSAYRDGRHAADTAYDRSLLASAREIAQRVQVVDGELDVSVPYIALDSFAYDIAGRIYYQVLAPDGRLLAGYPRLPAPAPSTPRTDDYPALARFYDGMYRGQAVRLVSLLQPVSEPGQEGMAEIRVAETRSARERMTRELLADTLWRMGMLSLAALALVWLTVSRALRPVRRLSREVEERRADDLRPFEQPVPRELLPLVHALNSYNQRLREHFERQEQFIGEAAHELRTPLAAIRARAELGLREDDPQVWQGSLREALRNIDRVTQLANQLLSLARIEGGARAIAEGGVAPLDLARLVRELALTLAPLAHQRGIELALEAPQAVWLRGEATLLNELVYNLIDNAMAHAPGGSLVLRVLAPGVLEVEDDGPGIPEHERERVFERFYRRQGGMGAGLGLAIVGEICRAHLARIELLEGERGGLRVRVIFPETDALAAE